MTKQEELNNLREELSDTQRLLSMALREREELAQSLHRAYLFVIVLGVLFALFKQFQLADKQQLNIRKQNTLEQYVRDNPKQTSGKTEFEVRQMMTKIKDVK